MSDIEYRAEFESELLDGEELIWAGRPDPTVHFSRIDFFLIPFGIIWCVPLVAGFVLVIFGSVSGGSGAGSAFPGAIFLIFVFVGFYFLVGRFIYKAWRKRHTYYALTSKRILIKLKTAGESLQGAFLDAVPAINIDRRRNGIGNVKFGNGATLGSMFGNTGLEVMGLTYGAPELAFYDLHDADRVYDLALRLRI